MNGPLLKVEHISKSFPGVKVLDDINIAFREGEVHAILGENGAGKSTLMNILFGYYHAEEGSLVWEGKPIRLYTPIEAQQTGISMVHQENSLIPYLSVTDNIYLGHYPKRGAFIDKKTLRDNAAALLHELEVEGIGPDTPVEKLSVAQKQLVEIVKALSLKPKLLMMDEPTAALTAKETATLMRIINKLREAGTAVVYVSHRMEEVFEVADRITVLRDGVIIKTADRGEIGIDDAVRLMVGRDLEDQMVRAEKRSPEDIGKEVALEVKNLSRKNKFDGVSFHAYCGEILGFGGLVGAGRSELMESIFGFDKADGGEIYLKGRRVNIASPYDALRHKLALVPEERKVKGLFPDLSVGDNINIASYKKLKKGKLIDKRLERDSAREYVETLDIKTTSVRKRAGDLSGGNQQKVILSRWLKTQPEILILDEPTHGIDVGAKAEIYRIIRGHAKKGIPILLVASELPELLMLSARIVVMSRGRVNGVLGQQDYSEENVMMYATGQKNMM
jgi:ABC-type sugar transport system ATPase subunit